MSRDYKTWSRNKLIEKVEQQSKEIFRVRLNHRNLKNRVRGRKERKPAKRRNNKDPVRLRLKAKFKELRREILKQKRLVLAMKTKFRKKNQNVKDFKKRYAQDNRLYRRKLKKEMNATVRAIKPSVEQMQFSQVEGFINMNVFTSVICARLNQAWKCQVFDSNVVAILLYVRKRDFFTRLSVGKGTLMTGRTLKRAFNILKKYEYMEKLNPLSVASKKCKLTLEGKELADRAEDYIFQHVRKERIRRHGRGRPGHYKIIKTENQ